MITRINTISAKTNKSWSRIYKSGQNVNATNRLINVFFLTLFILSSEVNALQADILFPFANSVDHPLIISKGIIPDHYTESAEFSLVYELRIIFDASADKNKTIEIFRWDQNLPPIELSIYFSKTTYEFGIKNDSFMSYFLSSLIQTSVSSHILTLNVVFEFTKSLDIVSKLIYFKNGGFSEPPVSSEVIWETRNFDPEADNLIVFNLADSIDYKLESRNLYVVDRVFGPDSFEFQDMYKGVASLQYAIYFYMEPAFSKILLNRSRYSYPPAISGEHLHSCSDLTSQYSTNQGRTNWMILHFVNEYLRIDAAPMQISSSRSMTFMLNFDLYLRNNNSDFKSLRINLRYAVVSFANIHDDSLLKLMIKLSSQSASWISYRFVLIDSNGVEITYIDMDGPADSSSPLAPDFILFNFFAKSELECFFKFEVLSEKTVNYRHHKFFRLNHSVDEIRWVFVGEKSNWPDPKNSVFLVVLHDLQIFHGGYLLLTGDNDQVLSAFSKDRFETVFCKANCRLSRLTGDREMDLLHESNARLASSCDDLVFNKNCIFDHCEICGKNACLVCAPRFKLVEGVCPQANSTSGHFDYFSRVELERNSQFNFLISNNLNSAHFVNYGTNTDYVLIEFEFENEKSLSFHENLDISIGTSEHFFDEKSQLDR